MTITIDPRKTFEAQLATDADLPAEVRPTFVFRRLTCREWLTLMEDPASDRRSLVFAIQQQIAAVELALVGWRNVFAHPATLPVEYEPGKLAELLSWPEMHELFEAVIASNRIGAQDAKKSASQSPEVSAGAVPPAAAETAKN